MQNTIKDNIILNIFSVSPNIATDILNCCIIKNNKEKKNNIEQQPNAKTKTIFNNTIISNY